jgi:hypothetical protein
MGLTLNPLVRWLRIVDDHVPEKEERVVRLKANEAALARIEELGSSSQARPESVERLRSEYADRFLAFSYLTIACCLPSQEPGRSGVSACRSRSLWGIIGR